MKNTTKRILSIICAAMMILSLAVVPAAAEADKALFISPGSTSAPWDWAGLKNGQVVSGTAVTEYTVSTKFNLANYVANGSGFGRPVALCFGGSAMLGLNPQASGQIKLYDTTTSNWGGAAAPAGDTLLATVTGDDWVEVTATVTASSIVWNIGGTETTVANRKALAAGGGDANYGYFYFMVDPGICATTGTWTHDWDLGIDYVDATFVTADGEIVLNDDMNEISMDAYPYGASNNGVWNIRMNDPNRLNFTVADDPTYVAAPEVDKYLSFSPGTGSGNWDWAGIKNDSMTAATGTEYTFSTRIKLANYAGGGRPFGIGLGGNAYLAFSAQASGSFKAYNALNSDWGGNAAPATATYLTELAEDTWYDVSVRAYLDGGAVKLDWTIGEETFTVDALKSAAAITTTNVVTNYGNYFFLIDPGISSAAGGNWVADWDMGVDNVSMTIGDVTVGGEFASVVTDPATIVGALNFGDGMTFNARMNSIGAAGYMCVTVYEDAVVDDGGEDDWVEPAIDKYVKFTKDASHAAWGGNTLLTNKANNDALTVSEYTTSFRFMTNGPSGNTGSWAGRPFGFIVDGAGKDVFSISSRADGKVYMYMSDSMDWGGVEPIPAKCAHYSSLLATANQGEWIDVAVRTYKTASGIRYDVTINGDAVLTGYEGSTTLADPMPMKLGGYFAVASGIGGASTEYALDYVKVEYEGSPEWMINEFKDAVAGEGNAAMTLRNDNKWVWGSGNIFTTEVLDDLTGVNYTMALSGDANAFVQAAVEDAPHSAAADVAVPAADAAMKVYAFAKAGYKVVGYKVDGGDVTPIIANDANLYTIPVAADCAVQFVTEAIGATTPVVAKKAAESGDKYLNFHLNGDCAGGSWWQSTIRATDLAYGTEFDRYVLEYKFNVSNVLGYDTETGVTKDRYILINMGNNRLGIMPEEDADKLHIYLVDGTNAGGEIVGENDVYLTTVNEGDWVEVKLVVYKEGDKVLTDVTANGNTKTALDVNKRSGGAYLYANPTPQVLENAGHGQYILQIDGISAAGSHKRFYDLAVDYVNLYAGDYTYEWDFADAYMSGNQIKWTGGDQGSNNFGAFVHSVVADTEVVNTALAAGYAAAVRDEFGGVSVIAKASGATEYGIIISPEVIDSLTVADLANYYVTNTATDSDIYAFKAYAQGTDGRFGVKVLGSAADATYFVGRTTPLYVYVYAVNGDAVDFAAVNTAGFLFN